MSKHTIASTRSQFEQPTRGPQIRAPQSPAWQPPMPGSDLALQMASAPDLTAGIDPAGAEKRAQEEQRLDGWFAERLPVFTSSGLSAERFGGAILLHCKACGHSWEVSIDTAMAPASLLCPRGRCNRHSVDADLDMHGR